MKGRALAVPPFGWGHWEGHREHLQVWKVLRPPWVRERSSSTVSKGFSWKLGSLGLQLPAVSVPLEAPSGLENHDHSSN